MVLDRKGNIAFLYEENANGGYDIVFNTVSLSTITGNAYAYRASDKGKYHTTSEPLCFLENSMACGPEINFLRIELF